MKKIKKDLNIEDLAYHIIVLVEGLMFMSVASGTESDLAKNGKRMAKNLLQMIKA